MVSRFGGGCFTGMIYTCCKRLLNSYCYADNYYRKEMQLVSMSSSMRSFSCRLILKGSEK